MIENSPAVVIVDDTDPGPALVVLGKDAEGKPHACWFSDGDADLATKAARLMNFHAVRLNTPEQRKLAAELPAGKVFASGKAFCPFVKAELYDRFAALVGTESELKPPLNGTAASNEPEQPKTDAQAAGSDPWAAIAPGTTVLATVGRPDGWWEAKVLAIDPATDMLTLTWCDWPYMAPFKARRNTVAVTA